MVKVTPLFTRTLPVRLYGLFVFVHVVFDLIIPLSFVPLCALPEGIAWKIRLRLEIVMIRIRINVKLWLILLISNVRTGWR